MRKVRSEKEKTSFSSSSSSLSSFAQKMTVWVCKVIRIAAVCVQVSVDVQHVPAMAVVGQPACPARRPGGGLGVFH